MSRLKNCFERLHTAGRKALIPYITAGDPEPGLTVGFMHALVRGGADILELGVPFSDPMADGPVITKAHERALVHHTSLRQVLAMVREFRVKDAETPVVLMGYLNPLEIMGYETFAREAAAAGVDGMLTVDLPPEEAGVLTDALTAAGLDPIYLLAPTSTPERIRAISAAARGYVYYVSVKGVTGSNALDVDEVSARVAAIRAVCDLPIGVGFGIKDAETAAAVARHADGVVVGSALVSRIAERLDAPGTIAAELEGFLRGLRQAMDAV